MAFSLIILLSPSVPLFWQVISKEQKQKTIKKNSLKKKHLFSSQKKKHDPKKTVFFFFFASLFEAKGFTLIILLSPSVPLFWQAWR